MQMHLVPTLHVRMHPEFHRLLKVMALAGELLGTKLHVPAAQGITCVNVGQHPLEPVPLEGGLLGTSLAVFHDLLLGAKLKGPL